MRASTIVFKVRRLRTILVSCVALALVSSRLRAVETASSQLRTWTSSNGQTVEAAFVGLQYNTVTLEMANGKAIKIGLSKLSAEDQKVAKENAAAATAAKKSRLSSNGSLSSNSPRTSSKDVLTDEQVSDLQVKWTNEKGDETISFSGYFSDVRLDPKKDKSSVWKYARSGKIPYRITAKMVSTEVHKGKSKAALIERGTCLFYVMDAEGTVIEKRSMPLAKMCPT